MILVQTGTQAIPFKRMVEQVVDSVESGHVNELVTIQSGATQVSSTHQNVRHFRECTKSEMDRLLNACRLVVTHGGTASIVGALMAGKKVAVMARRKQFDEHNDDHQLEITNAFHEAGYLLVWRDGMTFGELIRDLEKFKPVRYEASFDRIRDAVQADINRYLRQHGVLR